MPKMRLQSRLCPYPTVGAAAPQAH